MPGSSLSNAYKLHSRFHPRNVIAKNKISMWKCPQLVDFVHAIYYALSL